MRYFSIVVIGALLDLIATASAQAWTASDSRMTFVTFNRPVVLPGTTLAAGTYIFELANPYVNVDLVRVSSHDRAQVFVTTLTNVVERPEDLPKDQIITLGEPSRNGTAPVRAWFPGHADSGYEFIYR